MTIPAFAARSSVSWPHAGDLEVVGSAADGAQAVELAARLRPDVVIMDLAMPVLTGVDATGRICAQHEPPIVIPLSASRAMWREARAAGASCTMLKDEDPERLLATVRAAIGTERDGSERTRFETGRISGGVRLVDRDRREPIEVPCQKPDLLRLRRVP